MIGTSGEPTSALPAWQAGFRFLLELAALVCWAVVGWNLTDSAARLVLVGLLPLVMAATWGTFRVPGDASAGGDAPVPVVGIVRLLVELGVLGGAAVASALVWRPAVGIVLGALVAIHYLGTPGRVRWLLAQPPD